MLLPKIRFATCVTTFLLIWVLIPCTSAAFTHKWNGGKGTPLPFYVPFVNYLPTRYCDHHVSQSSSSSNEIENFDYCYDDDDENARSDFGTKTYWDDVYLGRGDFPAEEYSWYFGWKVIEKYVREYIPVTKKADSDDEGDNEETSHILCPGIGNDSLLVDLFKGKYKKLTAFDYSEHAIERQKDLLSYQLSAKAFDTIDLHAMDARKLPNPDWNDRFDAIIEKGALDAIYLSGDGNVELAVENLHRVLKPGGICVSVSGVVPEDLRKSIFDKWEWLRDGSDELKAGCFVLRKKIP